MAVNSQQNSETIVFRAGTKHGPSFNLKDESVDEVWLVTCPKLFFPLGQDLPISRQKHLEEVCLWRTDVSNLSNDFKWYRKCEYDGVIQIKLNDSRTSKNPVKEIQTYLKSLEWQGTTVPQCKGGFSLMNLSPLVQAVVVYLIDHLPTTPEELNFHAELKAASFWCWSDDCNQPVMKEALDNCRLKIAVTETLKTWKEEEVELQRSKDNKMDKDSDSSDESLDEQLSDVREAIGILNNYLEEVNSV
ncbi:PREDICTED: uncharacterized protein LOC107345061 isoform X2 [Acropora digitifera]|nr:PREDICTED: uncharacterized protein LOC107345061 isoform X2 [Acropora digitifera]